MKNNTCKMCGTTKKLVFLKNGNFSGRCKSCHIIFFKLRNEKIKKTNLEKYGCENPFQNEDIKAKIRETNKRLYGVDNPSKSETLQSKKKETLKSNYGVDFPLQNKQILDKANNTKRKKYGSLNNFEKIKKTLKQKYNVDNPAMIDLAERKEKYFKLLNSRISEDIEHLITIEEFEGINSSKQYKFYCKKCNKDFISNFQFLRNVRCPYHQNITSKAEDEIVEYLKQLDSDIEIIRHNRKILNGLELDIYLPKYNIAIEYNGLYWHSELNGIDSNYHLNKTLSCSKTGIKLIHIFEDEWCRKQEIVKLRLKHILQLDNDKIFARNCSIKLLTFLEKKTFLENTHLQGNDVCAYAYGLYYNSELVSVMTFSKLRIALGNKNKKDSYELSRFASTKNVIGGASKLFTYFVRTVNVDSVITYADKRWSEGFMYEKLGFKYVSSTKPNYWYLIKYSERKHRYSFRKSVLKESLTLFEPELSEWDNMKLNGYDRIWDCGSVKYIFSRD